MGTDRLKISKSLWLVGFVAALVVWAVMSPLRAYADDGKLEQQLNGQQSSQAPASNNGYVYDPDDPYGNGDGNADTPFEILNNRGVRAIDKQVGRITSSATERMRSALQTLLSCLTSSG